MLSLKQVVLFIDSPQMPFASLAAKSFEELAAKHNLAWQARVRSVEPSADSPTVSHDDLARANLIIACDLPPHRELILSQFTQWKDDIRWWTLPIADVTATIQERLAEVIKDLSSPNPKLLANTYTPAPPQTQSAKKPDGKGKKSVKVGRETAGRNGKAVTVISELPVSDSEMKEIATKLKSRCGTGGTVKNGRIEIQGDHRDQIIAELKVLGFEAKRAGG